jgi:hypothetical protein
MWYVEDHFWNRMWWCTGNKELPDSLSIIYEGLSVNMYYLIFYMSNKLLQMNDLLCINNFLEKNSIMHESINCM